MSFTRRAAFLAILLLSVSAGTLLATVPSKRVFVGELSVERWHFYLKDDQLILLELSKAADDKEAQRVLQWDVSAPTITAPDGRRLAIDAAGETPRVVLTKDKPAGADWTFDVVEVLSPIPYGPKNRSGRRPYKEGPEGRRFVARVGDGKYQGWYLAASRLTREEEDAAETKPVPRRLILVEKRADATIFQYIAAQHVERRGADR